MLVRSSVAADDEAAVVTAHAPDECNGGGGL
jgi:hypothetical protein